MEKLEGNENTKMSGDFVRDHQTMAKNDGFSAVSRLWYDKTKSFDWGMEQILENEKYHEDMTVKANEMSFEVSDDNRFMIRHLPTDRTLYTNDFSLKKLASWARCSTTIDKYTKPELHNVSKRVVYERDHKDTELIVSIIQNGFRDNRVKPDKEFLLRINNDTNVLRTVVSPEYKPVDNSWLFNIWSNLMPGARLSHWFGDEDNLNGNILIPDTIREESDSDYGGMVSVSNSQIGTQALGNTPSIFRSICMNGCIWGQVMSVGIHQIHRGKKVDLIELEKVIIESIQKQIPLIPDGIEKMLNVRSMKWDGVSMSSKPIFAVISQEYNLDKKQATKALEGYRDEVNTADTSRYTLFGVVNGLTRSAQNFDAKDRIKIENIAGNLIHFDKDDWSNMVNRAQKVKSKFVDSRFIEVA